MKTIPFDIEKAKAGAKVVTRDGREIKDLHIFDSNDTYPVFGVVDGTSMGWRTDGIFNKRIPSLDLFLIDESKTYTLPLSRRDALEITRDMWDWLTDNPGKNKHHWPELKNGNVPPLQNSCACCEFVDLRKNGPEKGCPNCPLILLWPQTAGPLKSGCERLNSPYYKWLDANFNDPTSARQIANAAREELKKMDEQEQSKHYNIGVDLASGKDITIVSQVKIDPYAELKKAKSEGKIIQYRLNLTDEWLGDENSKYSWIDPVECYRIKPEPKLRPWKPEEVPVGARFQSSDKTVDGIIERKDDIIYVCGFNYELDEVLTFGSKHSLDNGKTWHPCGILE